MLTKTQHSSNKIFILYTLIFIFAFFFIIEWHWQILLLGIDVPNPYIFVAFLSIPIIVINILDMRKKDPNFWFIYFLIIYFLLVALINISELKTTGDYKIATEMGVWCINIALFIVACNEKVWIFIRRYPRVVTFLFFLYALTPLLILFSQGYAAEAHLNLREAASLKEITGNSDYIVSYQSFGDKISILSFIVLSLHINRFLKIIVLVTTLISLYVVFSAASMVGYIFSCTAFLFLLLYYNRCYIKCGVFGLVCVCMLFFTFAYIVNNRALHASDNRMVSSIARGQKYGSVSSRKIIEVENQKSRSVRLMFGDYKFDNKLGRPGTYTHSAFGMVDYYGIIIFSISVGIWMYLFARLLFLGKKDIPVVNAALMSVLFYTPLFIIARFPVGYLTFWVLGSAISAVKINKNLRQFKATNKTATSTTVL